MRAKVGFFSKGPNQSNDDLLVKHEKPLDQIRVIRGL